MPVLLEPPPPPLEAAVPLTLPLEPATAFSVPPPPPDSVGRTGWALRVLPPSGGGVRTVGLVSVLSGGRWIPVAPCTPELGVAAALVPGALLAGPSPGAVLDAAAELPSSS